MLFIDNWVHIQKTPVPLKEIIDDMEKKNHKSYTVVNAINSLLVKGYIRRSVTNQRESSFVQLRRL